MLCQLNQLRSVIESLPMRRCQSLTLMIPDKSKPCSRVTYLKRPLIGLTMWALSSWELQALQVVEIQKEGISISILWYCELHCQGCSWHDVFSDGLPVGRNCCRCGWIWAESHHCLSLNTAGITKPFPTRWQDFRNWEIATLMEERRFLHARLDVIAEKMWAMEDWSSIPMLVEEPKLRSWVKLFFGLIS